MGSPYISASKDGQTSKIGFGFLVIPLSLIAFLWHPSFKTLKVEIYDDAAIFDSETQEALKESLTKIGQELDSNFVIATKSDVSLKKIAFEASAAAELALAKTLPPVRTFHNLFLHQETLISTDSIWQIYPPQSQTGGNRLWPEIYQVAVNEARKWHA